MNDIIKVGETINAISEQEVLNHKFNIYGTFVEPYFLAKDVSEWIGHTNTSKMLANIDEDEKTILTISYSGNMTTNQLFLTENGLYEVLMQSRKPIAKEFKKQVKKILHDIRTTGEYKVEDKFSIPQTLSEALYLAASQAKQIEEQNKQLEEQKPKVEFFNQVTDSTDAVDMKECAKILNMGIGRNRLFEFLRSRAILDRKNLPYQSFIDRGYFRTVETSYTKSDGTNCINIKTVVYQKGMDYIRKIYNDSIPKALN